MNKNYRWTRSGARIQLISNFQSCKEVEVNFYSEIVLHEITHAGHFPWIENPEEVQIIFQEFLTRQPM